MKRKDLAIGKYVILNRWLNKYSNLYSETLEIVSVPDTKEENVVGCRRITLDGCICTNNKYADETTTYINYIHLAERLSKPQLNRSPYVVYDATIRYDRYRDRNDFRVYIVPSDGGVFSMRLNVSYFRKDDNAWRGLFASQYYKKEIKFDENGELVKPVAVAKGSPAYNQILKEAKACGVIKG